MVRMKIEKDEYSGNITVVIDSVGEVTFDNEKMADKFVKDILISNGLPY